MPLPISWEYARHGPRQAGWDKNARMSPAVLSHPEASPIGEIAFAELFLAFEGIGNNCEFGIVQSYYGCDRPGLFRNVGFVYPETMIEAIETRLEGLFEDGRYAFKRAEDWQDWQLESGNFVLHTGIPASLEAETEDWRARTEQVISAHRMLKRMFLEDLAEGKKIFVFRSQQTVPMDAVRRLYSAIRAHGPGWLLSVTEDPSKPRGWTDLLEDGIIIGRLPLLSNQDPPQVDFLGWAVLAYNAWAKRQACEFRA